MNEINEMNGDYKNYYYEKENDNKKLREELEILKSIVKKQELKEVSYTNDKSDNNGDRDQDNQYYPEYSPNKNKLYNIPTNNKINTREVLKSSNTLKTIDQINTNDYDKNPINYGYGYGQFTQNSNYNSEKTNSNSNEAELNDLYENPQSFRQNDHQKKYSNNNMSNHKESINYTLNRDGEGRNHRDKERIESDESNHAITISKHVKFHKHDSNDSNNRQDRQDRQDRHDMNDNNDRHDKHIKFEVKIIEELKDKILNLEYRNEDLISKINLKDQEIK